jgi:hypothetical protein
MERCPPPPKLLLLSSPPHVVQGCPPLLGHVLFLVCVYSVLLAVAFIGPAMIWQWPATWPTVANWAAAIVQTVIAIAANWRKLAKEGASLHRHVFSIALATAISALGSFAVPSVVLILLLMTDRGPCSGLLSNPAPAAAPAPALHALKCPFATGSIPEPLAPTRFRDTLQVDGCLGCVDASAHRLELLECLERLGIR